MSDPAPSVSVESSPTPKPAANSTTGVKDTIESILVAFILAFVFRAFVVEAFVIPTGSMAPTLLGAHTRFHCPDCGYDFDVNFSARANKSSPDAEDPAIPANAGPLTHEIYCPNCGFTMPKEQVTNPPVAYGDRILVLKYLYLLSQPQRWDVVVFKAPIDLPTNYIKRLIGRPGETIRILDGDIYVKEPGSSDYVIQTKPKPAQDALWRLVYDNDYHPQLTKDRGGISWTQPWEVINGTGWKLDDAAANGRIFEFTGSGTESRLRFNPTANPTAQTTSDYMVYDQQTPFDGVPARSVMSTFPEKPELADQRTEMPVSDLDLRATYERLSGAGSFNMQLEKRDHRFTAEVSPAQVSLYHEFAGKRTLIGSPMVLESSSRPLRIELSNADYQVTLRVDDKIVAQSTPADFAPNIPGLVYEFEHRQTPPPGYAEIEAKDQHCNVSHISLWRDNYYYNDRAGVIRGMPGHEVQLKADEFLCMGDNSLMSYDGRCWPSGIDLPKEDLETGPGIVPARFLLGRAFYVYWPAGYSAVSFLPSFVPNFGAMRFIH